MSKKIKDPAIKSYWFGDAYRDLFGVITSAFSQNVDDIRKSFENMKDAITNFHFSSIFRIILYPFIILFIAIFGFLFTGIFSLIHILIVAVMMVFIYVGFMLLWFADFVYRSIHRISYSCEHCQKKYKMPMYTCPHCGREHYHLVPSSYGIFYRTCECGAKIPTTFLNGRQKLDSFCPNPECKEPLVGGISRAYIVPVIGGPNSGKTCFINAGIQEIEKNASGYGFDFVYHEDSDEARQDYSINKQKMEQGIVPDKTSDKNMKFYRFFFSKAKSKVKNQISFADMAGETFAGESDTKGQTGFKYSDGMFVIVDPFSLIDFNDYAMQEMKQEDYALVNRCDQPIDETVNYVDNAIRRATAQDKNLQMKGAIVFVKTDIPFVDAILGETAIQKRMQEKEISYLQASNEVGEEFLRQYGGDAFHNITKMFTSYQFFSVSALGKEQETGKAFVPINADKPMYWILQQITGLNIKATLKD